MTPDSLATLSTTTKGLNTMTITIEQLRTAVINDYAKLVYDDHGTQPDETSLEDYITKVQSMSYQELVGETWFTEGDEELTLESYVECFLEQDMYTDIAYQVNDDGSTTPME